MQAVMTDKGLLIPSEWLPSFGEFEIVREAQAIIILPLKSPALIRHQPVKALQAHGKKSARGKYNFVPTDSNAFAARKAEDY